MAAKLVELENRGLGSEQLSSYASKAMTTMGSEPEYLYFLPVILESQAMRSDWLVEVEVTGSKIGMLGNDSWSRVQQDAVKKHYEVLLYSVADRQVPHLVVDEVLCAIGRTGWPIDPYLDGLMQWPDAVGEFASCNLQRGPRLNNGFWDVGEAHDIVVAWLKSPAVKEIVDRYFRES